MKLFPSVPARAFPKKLVRAIALPFLLAAAAPSTGLANDAYPNKPVKVIVNLAAGGPTDVVARLLAEKLQSTLKQAFIVDNRTGSGGNIGAAAVAKADPDGYTMLISFDSPLTINPGLYPSMPFRPDELKTVTLLSTSGLSVAVPSSSGISTLKELISRARSDSMTFSSAGNGSPGHFASSMLAHGTGAKVTHVPYRGNAPAVSALVSQEVQAAIISTPGLTPHFKSGRLKPLAVTARERSPLLPDVPTVAELGYPDLTFEVYFVAMVPAKTPDAIVSTLQKSLASALEQPDVKERLRAMDITVVNRTGPKVDEQITASRERFAKIIKATGMKAD